jgi:hypothetical protein
VVLGILAASGWSAEAPDAGPAGLPSWESMQLTGHKLGETAKISVRASLVASDQAAAGWLRTDAAPGRAPSGVAVLLLQSLTAVAGRVFDEKAWLDPTNRAALQISDIETGAKYHRRLYRLLDRGFIFEERLPAGSAQQALAPEQWDKVTRMADVFPPALPDDAVVTGALSLLCADQAGRLRAPGDSVSIFVFVQKQVEEVTLTVESVGVQPVNFQVERAGRSGRVAGERQALTIRINNRPLDPQKTGAFRLFGMSDGIRVVWDVRYQAPLQVSGHLHLLGHFTIALDRLTLR